MFLDVLTLECHHNGLVEVGLEVSNVVDGLGHLDRLLLSPLLNVQDDFWFGYLQSFDANFYIAQLIIVGRTLLFGCFLHCLLPVEYLLVVVVHVLDLQLEVSHDVLNVPLGLGDALGVVFNQFSHHLQHVLLIAVLVYVVHLLHSDQALVVAVLVLEGDHGEIVAFLEGGRVLFHFVVLGWLGLGAGRCLCFK